MNETSNTDDTPVHQRFEPVDKPVRGYEIALLLLMEIVVFGFFTYICNQELRVTGFVITTVVLTMSLYKLFLPPRLSATRGAFVIACLISYILLFYSPHCL